VNAEKPVRSEKPVWPINLLIMVLPSLFLWNQARVVYKRLGGHLTGTFDDYSDYWYPLWLLVAVVVFVLAVVLCVTRSLARRHRLRA